MAMEEENNGNLLQEHPLLNSVVLKQVFSYLKPSVGLDTLKSIRQVCSVWRDESLGWWKETAVLNLTGLTQEPELTTITQLLDKKPFQKYKLEHTSVSIAGRYEEGTQANRFWSTVGPHVKHLILTGVSFRCSGFLKPVHKPVHALMQYLIDTFPNLSTLDIKDAVVVREYPGPFVFGDRSALELHHPSVVSMKFEKAMARYFALKNFPNLQHLALESFRAFLMMLQNEQISENAPIVHSSLKDLELILQEDTSFKDDVEVLDLLSQVKFPALERLSVDFRHGRHNSSFKFLPVLLKNHFEKLRILEVCCKPYVHPYYNFPLLPVPFDYQLDQLTELRLWGNVVRDLSFLRRTPKLKVLHMDPFGLEKKRVPEPIERGTLHSPMHDMVEAAVNGGGMEGIVLHDLEYLQINCGLLSLRSLETLGEWMPNLKTLRTVFGFGSLALICDQWPLLEELVGMHGSILTDEDIIGNSEVEQEKKGLLDFAEVKTFHLYAACNEGRLTDLAVHSGFLKMSKLTDLQICVSDKFTLEAEKLLKDILNVVVIRNYAGNEDHVNWECCKNTDLMEYFHRFGFDGNDSDSTTESESEEDDDEWYNHIFWMNDEEETESEDQDEEVEEEQEMTEQNDDEEEEKSQEESGDDTEGEKNGSDAQGAMRDAN